MTQKYDNQIYTLYAQINDAFSYIEDIPVAAAVVDLEENYVVCANSIFAQLFKLRNFPVGVDAVSNYDFSSFIREIEIAETNLISTDSETVMLNTAEDEKINADIGLKLTNKIKPNLAIMTINKKAAADAPKVPDTNKKPLSGFGFSDVQTFKSVVNGLHALVYVYDVETAELIYLNEYAKEFFKGNSNKEIVKKLGININSSSPSEEVMMYEKSINSVQFKMSEAVSIGEANRVVRLGIGINITETKRDEKKNSSGSLKDPLTGLYNKIAGFGKLQDCIDEVKQDDGMFSFCYLGIDKLDYVNKVFGSDEGDKYIKNVVSTVKKIIRRSDLFARVGRDEFMVVLTQCPLLTASRIMKSINTKLDELIYAEHKPYECSVSCGIVEVNSKKNLNLEKLVSEAKNEMFRIRFEGKTKD